MWFGFGNESGGGGCFGVNTVAWGRSDDGCGGCGNCGDKGCGMVGVVVVVAVLVVVMVDVQSCFSW